ncbi:tRNA methyltransferase complex GCD14 subunit [Neoconidiobolus thromboides FSU 785]|nr:tRNA methyltransferase complex GCD14 subunit [Neoconidiobolus thromboides FSU 785]
MSFKGYKLTIEEDDTVIMYFNRDVMGYITVTKGQTYNSRFGSFRHDDIIGKKYGLKFTSHTGKGFVYLLHPTPELWTQVVTHRTQILYMVDIAFISCHLDLKPGVKVIESGTGSGSFSHSIARTIGSTGHLYTFEYHEERAKKAKEEFGLHNLDKNITVTHKNVCKEGFGMENAVNAVFLDLPAPWEAIESAKVAFDRTRLGNICTFSPCIEQVQKSCQALADNGFSDIKTYECLNRNFEYKEIKLPTIEESIHKLDTRSNKRKSDNVEDEEKIEAKDKQDSLEKGDFIPLEVSKPFPEMRGHTSYLTFATLSPEIQKE